MENSDPDYTSACVNETTGGQTAKNKSEKMARRPCSFDVTFCLICCGVVGLGLCVLGLGLAKLVMGIIHIHGCELQPLLPVYHIVDFSVGLLFFTCILASAYKYRQDKVPTTSIATTTTKPSTTTKTGGCDTIGCVMALMFLLLPLFLLIWFIIGTVWVVRVRDEINAPYHCKETTTTSGNTAAASISPDLVSFQSSLKPSLPVTTQPAVNITRPNIVPCVSCNERFVEFTFAVIMTQWSLVGMALLCAIGALVVFGCIVWLCAAVNG